MLPSDSIRTFYREITSLHAHRLSHELGFKIELLLLCLLKHSNMSAARREIVKPSLNFVVCACHGTLETTHYCPMNSLLLDLEYCIEFIRAVGKSSSLQDSGLSMELLHLESRWNPDEGTRRAEST